MSFISWEIIGKICESWHTFLLTCKCSLYSNHIWSRSSSFLWPRRFSDWSINDTWLTAHNTFPTIAAKQNTLCTITLFRQETHPYLYVNHFWQPTKRVCIFLCAKAGVYAAEFMQKPWFCGLSICERYLCPLCWGLSLERPLGFHCLYR